MLSDSGHSAIPSWKSEGGRSRAHGSPSRFHTDTDLSLHSHHATLPCHETQIHVTTVPPQNAMMLRHWWRNGPEKNAPEGMLCTGLRGLDRPISKCKMRIPSFRLKVTWFHSYFQNSFLPLRKKSIRQNDFLLYVGQFLLRF